MSPWLSALSALERRISANGLMLSHYRAIVFVHEMGNVQHDQLSAFISPYVDEGESIIRLLFAKELLEFKLNTNIITTTNNSSLIYDETHRICQSRLAESLFLNPKR